MKTGKRRSVFARGFPLILAAVAALVFLAVSCGPTQYVLNEKFYFKVMTNVQYYPEQYVGATFEMDCFTYRLTDVDGKTYLCGVRKCSAGYGCTCGKDTVIGFILDYDGEIPAPKNQSEDTNEKTWVHITGVMETAAKTAVRVYAYNAETDTLTDTVETIEFQTLKVQNIEIIEDYSGLNYYVTK